MKLLHVSDTHIGKSLGRRSRLEEQEAILEEIVTIARAEEVDAVIHAGDLMDSKQPSGSAQLLAASWLHRLSYGGDIAVCLIGGNHDNFHSLQALDRFAPLSNVHIETEPVARQVHTTGGELGWAAMPFVPERRAVRGDDLSNGEPYATYDAYLTVHAHRLVNEIQSWEGIDRILLSAHVTIDGARTGTSERPLHIGEAYAWRTVNFPTAADYFALGHLHHHQQIEVPGSVAFYAGSPMQMDFGEAGDNKRVNIVELIEDPDCIPLVRAVDLEQPYLLEDRTIEWPDEPEGHESRYTKLRVHVERKYPGLAAEIADVWPTAVQILIEAPDTAPPADDRRILERTPREAFAIYWLERHGEECDAEVLRLFDELCEETWNE